MADIASIIVISTIVVSVAFLAWYTARRNWNVNREDDRLREDEAMVLLSEDEEEG